MNIQYRYLKKNRSSQLNEMPAVKLLSPYGADLIFPQWLPGFICSV